MISEQTSVALNIGLNAYSIAISMLVLIYLCIRKNKSKADKWFITSLVTSIVMEISDSFTWLFSGAAHPSYFIIHPIAMYVYYSCTFFLIASFIYYVASFAGGNLHKYGRNKIIIACLVIYYGVLLTNPISKGLFSFDENNIYSRGPLFSTIPVILEIILYITLVSVFVERFRYVSKVAMFPLPSFIVFPILMQVIQGIFYGISLVSIGYALSFILIFINTNLFLEKERDKNADEVAKKENRIVEIQEHTIISLSNLVENRDTDTGEHVLRTRDYVELLARQCLKDGLFKDIIDEHYIELLKKAAPMHDIGKIVVSDLILKKPAKLTDEEFSQMKCHASEGGRIVQEILGDFDDTDYIRISTEVASCHHEKYDGTGYPDGLAGDAIPLSARIMAIADVFDALVSARVYKEPMSYKEAIQIIGENSGTHFDPVLTEEFLKIRDEFISIYEHYKKAAR